MADSNLTKRALASALKELMEEIPFEKINIAQICEKCDMNRKSFYYHFKDKYDLVNWIFDIEFISVLNQDSYDNHLVISENLFEYFYENRTFYRKALKIKGQNSFLDHFREYIEPVLQKRLEMILDSRIVQPFIISFIVDVYVCAIAHWLLEKDCISPKQFISLLKSLIETITISRYKEMEKRKNVSDI